MARNQPKQQGPNAPVYANDTPSGFWARNLAAKDEAWSKVFALGYLIQADKQELARTLRAQISWNPSLIRWNNVELEAALNDGQLSATLSPGGMVPDGTITLVVSKSRLGRQMIESRDTLEIQRQGKWCKFNVTSCLGAVDDTDDSLTVICEPEAVEE